MKKSAPTAASLLALVMMVAGCTLGEQKPMGIIRVQLPGTATAQDIDIATAESQTKFYEVLAYNETTQTSLVVTSSGAHDLLVPVGFYKVLVLAGTHYEGYSTSSGLLLGSGLSPELEVVEGAMTDVAVGLTDISHTLSVPNEAVCGENFLVSLHGDCGVPVLQLQHEPPVYVDDVYRGTMSIVTNDQVFSCEMTLPAAPSPGTSSVQLHSTALRLVDSAYGIDQRLMDLTEKEWYWLNFMNVDPNNTVLYDEVVKAIDFVAAASGINVTITWGS